MGGRGSECRSSTFLQSWYYYKVCHLQLFRFSAAAFFFYRFAIQIPFCLSQVILFSYHAMFPYHYSQFLVASNIFCSVYYVLLILTFQEARGVTIQLWRVMRADWGLPDLEQCTSNSREWILSLFSSFSQEQNAVIMMTLWCIWHVYNDLTNNKPAPPTESSRPFLICDVKGKQVVNVSGFQKGRHRNWEKPATKATWLHPVRSGLELDVDGSFFEDGSAGAGMVLRDRDGKPIFMVCRYLFHCPDPLSTELAAWRRASILPRPGRVSLSLWRVTLMRPFLLLKLLTGIYKNQVSSIRELISLRPGV